MANYSVVFFTLVLLVVESRPAMAQDSWEDPNCADVVWYFLPCINFLQGFEPNPSPACCDQLDKLNTIAAQEKDGQNRICQCIGGLEGETGAILASRDQALSHKCGVRRYFPLGTDC